MVNKSLTWTCHFCGQERPDDLIGAVSRKNPQFPIITENRRYCKDRPKCVADAGEWVIGG